MYKNLDIFSEVSLKLPGAAIYNITCWLLKSRLLLS